MLADAIKQNEIIHKKIKKIQLEDRVVHIVENFIKERDLICYGGSAINVMLPKEKKIYDKTLDIPDYDFFSPNAYKHAKELAKIYADRGYENVEAKSAVSAGTFKVFVNFIPIADITYIHENIYKTLLETSITRSGIKYAPINFLKMSLYQELSRPLGDISRWEKVHARLELLKDTLSHHIELSIPKEFIPSNIHDELCALAVKHKWVIFGEYGMKFYRKHFLQSISISKNPMMYVLTESIGNIKLPDNYKITRVTPDYKFINKIYKVSVDSQPVMYIFLTNACLSYNIIKYNNQKHRVASIDSILSVYFALIYLNIPNIDSKKILSYCQLLENIHSNNKTNILKRFYMPCVGNQPSFEDIKRDKMLKYKMYKHNKSSKVYKTLFLRYQPLTRKIRDKS
jgi:hypothetical protein